MTAHARFAPSSIAQVVQCAGSIQLIEALNLPDTPTPESLEGDATHWCNAKRILEGDASVNAGDIAPNGVTITREMIYYGDAFVDACRADPGTQIEQRVYPAIDPDNWGTPDAFTILFEQRVIKIRDFKYGFVIVEAEGCWQVINYYEGVTKLIPNYVDLDWTVVFEIYQPRAPHKDGRVRSWTISAALLRTYITTIAVAIEAAKKPGAACTTGDECKYCPAFITYCDASRKKGAEIFELVMSRPTPFNLDALSLSAYAGLIERVLNFARAADTSLKTEIETRINSGEVIPGYVYESAPGSLKWIDESAVKTYVELMGRQDIMMQPPSLRTPTQVLEAARKDADLKKVVKKMSARPAVKKLARVDYSKAAEIFGK